MCTQGWDGLLVTVLENKSSLYRIGEQEGRGSSLCLYNAKSTSPHPRSDHGLFQLGMTLEITQWPTTLNILTWGSSEADSEAQFEYQWLIWEEALIGKWRSKMGKGWEPLNKQMTLWRLELSLSGGLLGSGVERP